MASGPDRRLPDGVVIIVMVMILIIIVIVWTVVMVNIVIVVIIVRCRSAGTNGVLQHTGQMGFYTLQKCRKYNDMFGHVCQCTNILVQDTMQFATNAICLTICGHRIAGNSRRLRADPVLQCDSTVRYDDTTEYKTARDNPLQHQLIILH